MSAVENLIALLKTSGQNVTKPRLAVFEALLGQESLSMPELIGKVREVDRASVYRVIETFERLGIIQRLHTGWKYKLELSDRFAEHHHHLTCTTCGRSIAMNEADLERVIRRVAAGHGFAPAAHQIEVQGTCADCRG